MTQDAPDEVSLHIDAPPSRCYEIVTDVADMGQLSPECTGGRWIRGADGPAPGARFIGFNRRGWAWWATLNRVVTADLDREFAFDTTGSGARWRYHFEPDGDGTLVTETREVGRRPVTAKAFASLLLGGIDSHDDELRSGMRTTLDRLKALAES